MTFFHRTLGALLLSVSMAVSATSQDIRGEWDAVGTCDHNCMFFVMDHVDKRAPSDMYFILPATPDRPTILGWPLTYVGGKQQDEWRIDFVGKPGALYYMGDKIVTPDGMTYKKRFDVVTVPETLFSFI